MARKNYKKFVASAATATLVASAIVPVASADVSTAAFTDVPKSYEDAINFVVNNNFSIGLSETQYGINETITRGDFAIILAKAAGLMDNEAPSAGFTDVPKRGALAVNSLKAAGVVNGVTETSFGFGQPIKRGDAAVMLHKALELESGDTEVSFTDVKDRYKEAVAALVNHEVTSGINATQFGTDNNIKRGDFAKWIYALENYIEIDATIESIDKLADIEILKGETVNLPSKVGVTYENGNKGTAAVEWDTSKLDTDKVGTYALTGDVEGTDLKAAVNVIVKADELGPIQNAAITTTVIDDDQEGQFIEYTVNGKYVSVDQLKNAYGVDVEFQATESVFLTNDAASTTSQTGEIDATAVEINDSFDVKIVLTKDGKVTQSEYVTVDVVNLNATPKLNSLALNLVEEVTTGEGDDAETSLQKVTSIVSDTLVTGETYQVAGLRSVTGNIVGISGVPTYSSSDKTVAQVNAETGVITPVAPGTATITAKAGNQTATVEITVTNEDRELGSVTIANDALKLSRADGTTRNIEVEVKDQYGDLYDFTEADLVTTQDDKAPLDVELDPLTGDNVYGLGVLTVTVDGDGEAAKAGNYGIYIKEDRQINTPALQTVEVQLTEGNVADPSKTKLELASGSTAKEATITTSKAGVLNINEYTVDGGFVQTVTGTDANTDEEAQIDVGAYTVEVANPEIAYVTAENGEISVIGKKAGTTDITVTSADGNHKDVFTVKVTDPKIEVTNVNWTSTTTVIAAGEEISVYDVLDIDEVDEDNIVKGLTLNLETTSFVRIADNGDIYLDVNDNGIFTEGTDIPLGTVALSSSDLELAEDATSYTTAAGDKGTLVFTFIKEDGDALRGTTVDVDVKGTPITPAPENGDTEEGTSEQ